MVSIQDPMLKARKEPFKDYVFKLFMMGISNYSEPLTHPYIQIAQTEYDKVTS